MARMPKKQGEEAKPEILRTISLGDEGDLYGPGEEDEFLEALEDYVELHNSRLEEGEHEMTVEEELERLHRLGHLANFDGVNLDEDEIEDDDPTIRAGRQAMLEDTTVDTENDPDAQPGGIRRATTKKTAKKKTARRRKAAPKKDEE